MKRKTWNPPDRIQEALRVANWPLVVELCTELLRKDAKSLVAHRMLGFAWHRQHKTDKALNAYQAALKKCRGDAELLINYANVLLELSRDHEALPLMEEVVRLRPELSVTWSKLAQSCYKLGLHKKGFEAAQQAWAHAQTVAQQVTALNQRAIHRRELGQIREAVLDCMESIRLAPQDAAGHSNRLLFMLADPSVSANEIKAAAVEYAAMVEASALNPVNRSACTHGKNPWKRLRIGFLSPDFRAHAVMYSIEDLLAQLDRRQFEVFGYYLYPASDQVTERARIHCDHFVELAKLSPEAQLQTIRDHHIDVLVDLAGHTGNNGLHIVASRVAPIQVAWLGFPATTGLHSMDYRITDEVTDPVDAQSQYSEKLYRLPTLFCCYRPHSRNPLWRYQPSYSVHPSPVLKNGFITFGSCNNLGKLTDEVLRVWGKILHQNPTAKLLIEGKGLEKADFSQDYRHRCAKLGIPIEQLELVPLDTANQYLTYHRIDIALDPFPLTGGITTFDLLWMGVPLVSMEGDCFKSRLSTGILAYLGRTEWLAQSEDRYVEIATQLASDPARLHQMRQRQRAEVESSPLMSETSYRQHFSEAMRVFWLQLLAQTECPDDEVAQDRLMQSWLPSMPAEWQIPAEPGVGTEPGKRISLTEAHTRLESLLSTAQRKGAPSNMAGGGQISSHAWADVTSFATTILCAEPHDPVALAVLAEVEHAHGHTAFAVTYLQYAQAALAKQVL